MDIILERIVQELSVKKIKKTDLTERLGFSSSAIFGHWLSGRNSSYKKYIHAIAEYLNVSVEYLRGETDQKKKPLVNEDEELTEYLEELKNRSEMRMLFSVTSKCTKEEVEQAVRIIEALRKGNNDEPN